MKKNLKLIVLCSSVVLAIIAFIMLALPGIARSEDGVTVSVGLGGLVFGGGKLKSTMGGLSINQEYTGGLSFFALIGVILLVLAVVAVVVKVLTKKKNFELIAACLFVLAGISMFLVMVAGTDVTVSLGDGSSFERTATFKEAFEELKVGVGAILFGIFSILAGCCACTSHFLKETE